MTELGWSRERLAAAAPDVVEAARWKLFVTAVWPFDLVESLATPEPAKTAREAERARHQARTAGRAHVERIRKLLFPPDEAV